MNEVTFAQDYKDMTTERLIELEEWMYDMEVEGVDMWFERDQIINELNKRDWK